MAIRQDKHNLFSPKYKLKNYINICHLAELHKGIMTHVSSMIGWFSTELVMWIIYYRIRDNVLIRFTCRKYIVIFTFISETRDLWWRFSNSVSKKVPCSKRFALRHQKYLQKLSEVQSFHKIKGVDNSVWEQNKLLS